MFVYVVHNNDYTFGTIDTVHGTAHSFYYSAEDHPVRTVAILRYLHPAKDSEINMPAPNHSKGFCTIKKGRTRYCRNRFFTGINQVRILFPLNRVGANPKQTVF